ncbi:BON domain-containing protein [Pseudomonas sp. gcc21]|uniref:BON domain-containing protein n=1 Tax=Pseudomonas sp. gcc21 TaxID=2726989 RepID=UPI001451846F|nr:BON domain-containing protein [Pseudomonas sp. gcc21]QJD59787.1 BON domain-containing protein [Pseudomonas sp. gcc21]
MYKLEQLAIATATAGLVVLSPMAAHADDSDMNRQLDDARAEGSVSTAIATNRNLSPFSIDVDVEGNTAVLTGEVESEVEKDLAEQIAADIDGIENVDNQLQVGKEGDHSKAGERTLADRMSDTSATATIKSKLLWNNSTEGLDIHVDTENGVVTLTGETDSSASKELAERLAEDTDGVREVRNELQVTGEDATETEEGTVAETADDAGNVISDAWITSKVKSSYLFSRSLSGLDISVDTNNGKVVLEGSVDTDAEKDLAEQTAKNIRGVKEVDSSALSVAE